MIKRLKANKIITLLLIAICFIFILNPKTYINSCLNGLSVWALKILPGLFPFFVLTRLIVSLSAPKTNVLDKFFCKTYHSPIGSLNTYLLSILSGYPMGAKLICTNYELGYFTREDAKKMLSYCSVSGPMFMIGTVGIGILNSYKAGLCIMIANIIASLINGLIYRGKKQEQNQFNPPVKMTNPNLLSDTVYDSMQSILMVGGFIVLSFLFVDIMLNLNILQFISNSICSVFNCRAASNIVVSVLIGSIEITRGIIDLSSTGIPVVYQTIIASGIIGFGGVSVLMQSTSFLKKLNISTKTIIIQKLSQGIIAVLIAIPLAILLL